MKIAVASEDGRTVSRHFGRASQYVIVSTAGGLVLAKEIRPKARRTGPACGDHKRDDCICESCADDDSVFDRHRPMVLNILDCDVMLAGGMGWGAYEGLKARGVSPAIVHVEDIEEAIKLYLEGNPLGPAGHLH